jgi:excinuclease ABC subunit B
MFKLVSKYEPAGDQITAIDELVKGIEEGKKSQVLLGATGTGKTFTMANVIAKVNKPTLILAHNKTLAGQLYAEMKELFPDNRVEYFVSYYDYYQPEAYVPQSDTYIEKDASINDEIDELRHAATESLLTRDDTIIVSSVSCIYGLGDKADYEKEALVLCTGDEKSKEYILGRLVDMGYERNELDFHRGTFRSKGDTIDIVPSSEKKNGIRVELFGDEIDRIVEFDVLTGSIIQQKKTAMLFPATHFVTNKDKIDESIRRIEEELKERLEYFKENNKHLEEQRLRERCTYDIEMLKETGFCHGIENYSRHLALRGEGETPSTLIDFFPKDFLLIVDESHVTIPQVRGMYNGDRMRKTTLVEYGFRLPSALDNRPLQFDEFEKKLNQTIYVSATPGDYEMELVNNKVTEQIIRPTGLLDPKIEVRKTEGQIDDLIEEIDRRIAKGQRTLVTTLTKRMAEDLSEHLKDRNVKTAYIHSDIDTLERGDILRDLRTGVYDVLVGINLLREGLDLPEVSLVAILDADKEGFLRSERSLIQTIGRAARNSEGRVIMYADHITDSMRAAISETNRRRSKQQAYNLEHGIVPRTIVKDVKDTISSVLPQQAEKFQATYGGHKDGAFGVRKNLDIANLRKGEREKLLRPLEKEMKEAARRLEFEEAAQLRDAIMEIRSAEKAK